jgi:hypothetical protein
MEHMLESEERNKRGHDEVNATGAGSAQGREEWGISGDSYFTLPRRLSCQMV